MFYWSDTLLRTDPYQSGEQPKGNRVIKLNTNENPYPPSPKVLEAIRSAVTGDLRLYPDPDATGLRQVAAKVYGLSEDQIFVGNGSDEVLAFSFLAFFNPGEKIRFPDISYSFYPVYTKLFGLDAEQIPLRGDFTLPTEKFFRSEGGVVFPNPNSPTGLYLPLEEVESILANNKERVVIIDEAYIDFGGDSACSLLKDYENLLVIQTLSKSRSLAGLRVGFAFGHPTLIEGLNRIKNSVNSYTIDRLALTGAEAALADGDYSHDMIEKIIKTRDYVSKELEKLGFLVLDSKTNFLFISHKGVEAKWLYERLKEKEIYVRYFNKPRIDRFIRVTVGRDDEMALFLKEVKNLLPL